MAKRVLIFGLKDPAGGVESAVMNYVRNFDRTRLVCDVVVFSDPFSLGAEIQGMGGKVICLPNRRKNYAQYRAAVSRIFEDGEYCAVWCNLSGLTNMDIPELAQKKGIPVIVAHSHTSQLAWGSPVMKYVVHAMHYYYKGKVGRYFTDFFGCSRKSAVFMFGEKYGSQAKIIPNAIDASRFRHSGETRSAVRSSLGLQEKDLVIGHVGRMCVAKNQKFLLDVFRALSQRNPGAKLLFVGDGELQESVLAYASQIGIDGQVIFTGARGDVDRLLSAMDVFFLPSVTEGFPVTLVEAQAASLPCVVSAEAVLKETDLTGHMRFVSLGDDMENWVHALEEASRDPYHDGNEIVAASEYDIHQAAGKLEQYFTGGKLETP